MTVAEFNRFVDATNLREGRTLDACRLVLLEGMTAYAAAKHIGIDQSSVSRALKKIPTDLCEQCGQPLPRVKK